MKNKHETLAWRAIRGLLPFDEYSERSHLVVVKTHNDALKVFNEIATTLQTFQYDFPLIVSWYSNTLRIGGKILRVISEDQIPEYTRGLEIAEYWFDESVYFTRQQWSELESRVRK